jgi:hypothetical protein
MGPRAGVDPMAKRKNSSSDEKVLHAVALYTEPQEYKFITFVQISIVCKQCETLHKNTSITESRIVYCEILQRMLVYLHVENANHWIDTMCQR